MPICQVELGSSDSACILGKIVVNGSMLYKKSYSSLYLTQFAIFISQVIHYALSLRKV
jgi:hypothetical protein